MTKILTLFLSTLISVLSTSGQQKLILDTAGAKWDLRRCVEYAMSNNISIKQADVDARSSRLNYDLTKWAQFGTASANSALALNFGRSINQTTNVYTDNQGVSQYINLNVGITLFNWSALRRARESGQFNYDAQVVNIDRVKNDITLNVANSYLLALLAKEQVTLAQTKLGLTKHQLANTRALVDAGSLPELNAAELEVQFATDSAAVITAAQTYDINTLQLKAILNLDAAAPFDLDTPPVETIPVTPIAQLQPNEVYGIAINNFPQQKMNDLRITANEKSVDYNKALLYPTISAYASLGTRFFNDLRKVTPVQFTQPVDGAYAVGGTPAVPIQYPVSLPNVDLVYSGQPFYKAFTGYGDQLTGNFGQQVGLQLNVPIFNGNIQRTAYHRAQLNVLTSKLTKENDLMNLKQGVYQAYANAVASFQKFESNKKAVGYAEKSFDLSTKRYNLGMLNTIDYLVNQNALFTARINLLSTQYDYVFRIKILEYYKGLGIKL